jgi:hypothetical protein
MHIREFGRIDGKKKSLICQPQQEGRPKLEQRELGVSKTVESFHVESCFLTTYAFNKVKIFDCNLHNIHLKANN